MANAIETLATIILLVLLVFLFLHMLQGNGMEWIKSKFTVTGT